MHASGPSVPRSHPDSGSEICTARGGGGVETMRERVCVGRLTLRLWIQVMRLIEEFAVPAAAAASSGWRLRQREQQVRIHFAPRSPARRTVLVI